MTDVTCAVGVDVPADIRALCSLPSIDYIDLFTGTPVPQATPETWAKAVMERAAGEGGQLLWRRVLGLRLARKPGNIAGWTPVGREEDWIRVEARSWQMIAQLVLHNSDGQAFVATALQYRGPLGRLIWAPCAHIHRRAMPGLLRKGAALLRAGGRGQDGTDRPGLRDPDQPR